MNYVKGEKFKNLEECLVWCADNKPVDIGGMIDSNSRYYQAWYISRSYHDWHKAIKVPENKMKAFYLWMNPETGNITGKLYDNKGFSVIGRLKLDDAFSVRLDWSKTMIEVEGEE